MDQVDPTLEERDEQVAEEVNEEEASTSVVHRIKKKIRLEKKLQQQVGTGVETLVLKLGLVNFAILLFNVVAQC